MSEMASIVQLECLKGFSRRVVLEESVFCVLTSDQLMCVCARLNSFTLDLKKPNPHCHCCCVGSVGAADSLLADVNFS